MGVESIPLNPSLSRADTSRCLALRWERPGGEAGLDPPELGLRDRNQATSPLSEPGQPGGEGNDNPLQCSCLENLRDGEVWWAAVSVVPQSDTTEVT